MGVQRSQKEPPTGWVLSAIPFLLCVKNPVKLFRCLVCLVFFSPLSPFRFWILQQLQKWIDSPSEGKDETCYRIIQVGRAVRKSPSLSSCSKQGQLWGQTRLLRVLSFLVLKTSKDGDYGISISTICEERVTQWWIVSFCISLQRNNINWDVKYHRKLSETWICRFQSVLGTS